MAHDEAAGGRIRRLRLTGTESLNRPERIALLVILSGAVTFDLIGFFLDPDPSPIRTATSIVATLTFALYVWSPVIATAALAVAVALSFVAGTAFVSLPPAAFAAGMVLRLGSTPLAIAYAGGFLIATALFASGIGVGDGGEYNVAIPLIIATVAGAVGLALRFAQVRGRRLEQELAEQAEREKQAVLAERRWIAGELHDSIAHHLTIVAMHSQLLDDDAMRETSQDAIRVAARKALSDLRFVIRMAEDAPVGTEVPSGDLASAVAEAREEIEAAGHRVVCEGDPSDESIPRGAEIILARIVRESATNILKYAGPGAVVFAVDVGLDAVVLSIRSPKPATPRRDMPSTGTGLRRMAERVRAVRGEFTAGPMDDAWVVSVRLPLTEAPVALSSEE